MGSSEPITAAEGACTSRGSSRPAMEPWPFSAEFIARCADSVKDLERWKSYGEIVQKIVATSRISLPKGPMERHPSSPGVHRVSVRVQCAPKAIDALFNSAVGYRAQFLKEPYPEASRQANRSIVDALVTKHASQFSTVDGACSSLAGAQAKVWIQEDDRVMCAMKGLGPVPPEIEIAVPRWVASIDVMVLKNDEARYFARAGVLATTGSALVLKGGWIRASTGAVETDDYKGKYRAEQIHRFGFT